MKNKPFLLSKFQNEEKITLMTGDIKECKYIADIEKIKQGKSVVLLPFSVANEKYDFVKTYGKNITVMNIKEEKTIDNLDSNDLCDVESFSFTDTDEEYMRSVERIIENEIKNGEGANFMICRKGVGKITNFSREKAISMFARLVKNEYGAYQIFCFFTGKFFLIGASPECHLSLQNGQVRMQPISGTFVKTNEDISILKSKFISFLQDKKEINELFMTVDEELKMMAKICPFGGKIIGPRLREMSKVIHTEYLLTGKTEMNVYEAIKESVHAATLIGSPLENSFRITQEYNDFDKEYYGSFIGILEENGNFNSSIIIRSVIIDLDGSFRIFAGASIVKDSVPNNEMLEVKAKIASTLNNLKGINFESKKIMPFLECDHDVCEVLEERNQNLSHFWFFDKTSNYMKNGNLVNKKVIIIDNQDSFTEMIKHILQKMGLICDIIPYNEYSYQLSDLVIVGPGPGDPNDSSHKMIKLNKIVADLLLKKKKIIGICLGHQILSKNLGFNIVKADKIMQGEQQMIDLFGIKEKVGFYNTFFAIDDKKNRNLTIALNDQNDIIYGIKSDYFASFQFHPESILTQSGFNILEAEILRLL